MTVVPEAHIDEHGFHVGIEKQTQGFSRRDLQYFDIVSKQSFDNTSLNALAEVENYCRMHNIGITYFSPTFAIPYIRKMNLNKLYDLRKEILDRISGYYDLTYIENISTCDGCFTDINHIDKNSTSHIFINIVKKVHKHYFINKYNIDSHFEKLESL